MEVVEAGSDGGTSVRRENKRGRISEVRVRFIYYLQCAAQLFLALKRNILTVKICHSIEYFRAANGLKQSSAR